MLPIPKIILIVPHYCEGLLKEVMRLKICSKCGTVWPDDTIFCQECGYRLNNNLEESIRELKKNEAPPPKRKSPWTHFLNILQQLEKEPTAFFRVMNRESPEYFRGHVRTAFVLMLLAVFLAYIEFPWFLLTDYQRGERFGLYLIAALLGAPLTDILIAWARERGLLPRKGSSYDESIHVLKHDHTLLMHWLKKHDLFSPFTWMNLLGLILIIFTAGWVTIKLLLLTSGMSVIILVLLLFFKWDIIIESLGKPGSGIGILMFAAWIGGITYPGIVLLDGTDLTENMIIICSIWLFLFFMGFRWLPRFSTKAEYAMPAVLFALTGGVSLMFTRAAIEDDYIPPFTESIPSKHRGQSSAPASVTVPAAGSQSNPSEASEPIAEAMPQVQAKAADAAEIPSPPSPDAYGIIPINSEDRNHFAYLNYMFRQAAALPLQYDAAEASESNTLGHQFDQVDIDKAGVDRIIHHKDLVFHS